MRLLIYISILYLSSLSLQANNLKMQYLSSTECFTGVTYTLLAETQTPVIYNSVNQKHSVNTNDTISESNTDKHVYAGSMGYMLIALLLVLSLGINSTLFFCAKLLRNYSSKSIHYNLDCINDDLDILPEEVDFKGRFTIYYNSNMSKKGD